MEEILTEKLQKSKDSSCPNCGATLVYEPEKGALFCDSCGTVKKIEKLPCEPKIDYSENEKAKATEKYKEWVNENKVIKCKSCGANVVLNKLEYSKTCPYCGSAFVVESGELPTMAPQGIIPFYFSKQQASDLYRKGMRKKFFLPNAFKKAVPVENIKGIYIPSFSFDANSYSSYSGVLERTETRYVNGKTQTYTTTFRISGDKNLAHKDVMVESSSLITQRQFDELKPFNASKIVKFDNGYIMGYSVENYEQGVDLCKKVADEIMKEQIRSAILSGYSYSGVRSLNVDTTFEKQKYGYYVLPVYKNEYQYKNKKYTTFMNGESGKVGGGVPRSPIKITFFVLFLILVAVGFVALFMYLNGLE